MSFEMSCANCEGRLMVETLGIVVACPHCGTHLSIPAEIPGLADASPEPESPPQIQPESPPSPIETNELQTESSDGPENPWASAMEDEQLANSFPDFSQASESAPDQAASESNVIVSEPETQTETDVPSAIRVANPDPSAVIPAIITDAAVSEPVSGFPVLGEPKPSANPQDLPESDTVAEEKPVEITPVAAPPTTEEQTPKEVAPILSTPSEPTNEFAGINIGDETDNSESFPTFNTETPDHSDGFPMINVGGQETESENFPSINTET
ncbi:MAG: hypothetical protein KDA84_30160, partial [Planctomycetaceae bacterium]|nr:hypothetical protein [Planctomycetaceae bacterium]